MKQHYKISQVNPSKGALDFSYLLDAPAGTHGFVKVKDGHFYFEDGLRARFLGFNIATRSNTPDHKMAEMMAERFASLGVNIIRLHAADAPISDVPRSWASCRKAPLLDYDKGSSRFFHPEGLDRFDYLVAKLKEKGIYLHIDLIVAREFLIADGLEHGTKVPSCTKCYPMYNDKLLELQKEYAKELLTHVNPYTKLALIDDPAVVTVQINNEESAIKGTQESDWIPEMQPYRDEVRRKWNHFLLNKYENRESLEKAWTYDGKCALREDEDPEQGTVSVVPGNFYQPTNDPNADWDVEIAPVRYADYMEFGIAQNRRFYQKMKAYLIGLGVKVPIVASNLVAGAADVYGHSDGDLMENNCYFNHPLFPLIEDGYNSIMPSEYVAANPLKVQTYVGAMSQTLLTMASIAITKGKAFMLSEWNEYGIVPFHSTSYMHTIAYACLNDWDGLILYNYQTSELNDGPEDEILSVFDAYNDPSLICQWGMMAEVFFKGLVSVAKHQIDLVYTQADLRSLPPMMGAPMMYAPYITKMRNVFLDGDTYHGDADVAINAGFFDNGNLTNAKHSVYYAWSKYVDAYRNGTNPYRLKEAAKNGTEIGEGVHLSDTTLVYDNIQAVAGSGNYEQFAGYLDQALKSWGILEKEQGLWDGAMVSDTGEIRFAPDQSRFQIATDQFAFFSGNAIPEISLNEAVTAYPDNEKITLALLNRGCKEGEQEALFVAMSDTGMDDTTYEPGEIMMGIPSTRIRMKGKLYVNTFEGKLSVKANHARLELLSQEGDVLTWIEADGTDGRVTLALKGDVPALQYRLVWR